MESPVATFLAKKYLPSDGSSDALEAPMPLKLPTVSHTAVESDDFGAKTFAETERT